ncbi:hypothetical protein [Psychrobacillus psychrodurans]|uniref:hypothetical protein n=1 Tax=Psychrobacillus psychrodurans TaxID=126157 RepID=UPI003D08B334
MIKIGRKIEEEQSYLEKFLLLINDIEITNECGYIWYSSFSKEYDARIWDLQYATLAFDLSFRDAMLEISKLNLIYQVEFTELIDGVSIKKVQNNDNDKYVLSLEIGFDNFENWKNPYSIQEIADALSERINKDKNLGFKWKQSDDEIVVNGCQIVFETNDENESIKSFINAELPTIKKIYDEVIEDLLSEETDAVFSVFSFPEHVSIPCEQYLLYFAQFLKELGIDATADIKHEAGNVLFSVTPTSGHSALMQIRQALDIYLQMPVILSNSNYMQIPNDPKVQQLLANIQHLNGQLMLSNAILQVKEQTIQQQQVIIRQHQQIIDATILQNSLLSISQNEMDDKEDILGGTVSIKKFEGKGFELNLPTIYRWVRNLITKD